MVFLPCIHQILGNIRDEYTLYNLEDPVFHQPELLYHSHFVNHAKTEKQYILFQT